MIGLLATAAFAGSAPAAGAAAKIADPPSVTALRPYRNTLAGNQWDPVVKGYRFWLYHDGATHALPIPTRPSAEDFDLGTDAKGVPLLVYTRCNPRCDVYAAGFGGAERKLRAASSPTADESAPTRSRGRIATGTLQRTRQARGPKGSALTGRSASEAFVLRARHPDEGDDVCPCRIERRTLSGWRRNF